MSERQRDVASPLELNSLPGSPQSVVDESLDRNGEPPCFMKKRKTKRKGEEGKVKEGETERMECRAVLHSPDIKFIYEKLSIFLLAAAITYLHG